MAIAQIGLLLYHQLLAPVHHSRRFCVFFFRLNEEIDEAEEAGDEATADRLRSTRREELLKKMRWGAPMGGPVKKSVGWSFR